MIENPASSTGITRVWISVDINGIVGKPNRLGVDVFTFVLTDTGLKLMGAEGTEFTVDKFCSLSGSDYRNGFACANKVVNEPDYFKKVVKDLKL